MSKMCNKEKTGDYKKAFQEARMFSKLAEECSRNSKDGLFFDCIYSLTVNVSFACEVFLKGICLVENGCFYLGHYLMDQFKRISIEAQQAIKTDFCEEMKETDFNKALTLNNNAFEDWRYPFEEKDNDKDVIVDIYALLTLMRCLERYSVKLEATR